MEQAEYEMFESIGEKVVGDLNENSKGSGWPRSKVEMKFLKPLRFQEEVEIHLKIKRIRNVAIEYEADFYRLKDSDKELVSIGKYQAVSCLYDSIYGEDPEIVQIPEDFLSKVGVFGD